MKKLPQQTLTIIIYDRTRDKNGSMKGWHNISFAFRVKFIVQNALESDCMTNLEIYETEIAS